jgi:hypothetical protein
MDLPKRFKQQPDRTTGRRPCRLLFSLLGFTLLIGCSTTSPQAARQLIDHQSMIDFSGLEPMAADPDVHCSLSIPQHWKALPLKEGSMYKHQQWQSPSGTTMLGIVWARSPLPLPAKTIVWLAKDEYAKKKPGGKLLNEWTDKFGRQWFEAQTDKHHGRGYVIVDGRDIWIAYSASLRARPLAPGELSQSARCLESIRPEGVTLAAERD